jgi:predicted transcriptional regulator
MAPILCRLVPDQPSSGISNKQKPAAVSDLAGKLRRDTRAVSRDVDLLEEFGLLQSRYETNPGHGKRRIIHSLARQYQLLATI